MKKKGLLHHHGFGQLTYPQFFGEQCGAHLHLVRIFGQRLGHPEGEFLGLNVGEAVHPLRFALAVDQEEPLLGVGFVELQKGFKIASIR